MTRLIGSTGGFLIREMFRYLIAMQMKRKSRKSKGMDFFYHFQARRKRNKFLYKFLIRFDGPIVLVLPHMHDLLTELKKEVDKFGASSEIKSTSICIEALSKVHMHKIFQKIQEKSKLSARITSEVLRLLVEAFNAEEYKEANSLCFQANSLSTAGSIILKQVEDNQVDLKWELPAIGCFPSLRILSKEYGKLNLSLAGMEMALKSSSPSQIGDTTHVLLKDPLLRLTTWTSLALKHAGSASISTNSLPGHNKFILEQRKEALKLFEEALAIVLQRIRCTNMQKPYTSKPTSLPIPDHELRSINSEELDEVRQGSFKYHLPTCFFMFSMKHLCKEAINMLRPCAEKVQQIAPLNPNSESTEGSNYCRQCTLPLRTISVSVDASQEESSQAVDKSRRIWQFLCKMFSQINTTRLAIALKCSLSLGLSVLLGVLFSPQRGYWAGIAVAISMGTSREATFKLANVRAQGTVAGSVYAVIASILTAESILLRAVALIPWVIFTSFLRQSKMYGYAGGLSAFIAAIIILGQLSFLDPPSEFAIVRITETFIGIGCYILVEVILQPRRASTLARKELVVGLCSLHDFTNSFVSAQTRQGCVHSYASALLELKEKERKLKDHISQLTNYIEEAKVQPDFWFLPFPATAYSKLLNSYSKITDMLHFATLSYEYIVDNYIIHLAKMNLLREEEPYLLLALLMLLHQLGLASFHMKP